MASAEHIRRDLAAVVDPSRLVTGDTAVNRVRRDTWVMSVWRGLGDRLPPPPACVVRPETTEEVAAVLAYAARARVPVVPFGAGSGVCGAILPDGDTIVVDLGAMHALVGIDDQALLATAQAGLLGSEFEEALNRAGYTMGHFPQSIALSSVGGWVATRSAGQFSTKYGNIEELFVAFEAVLPSGTVIRTRPTPRASTGPDLRHLFLGAEGTTGILTELTFQIRPLPEARERHGFAFPSMRVGLEALRQTMRAGWRPAVLRLYDEIEAGRTFAGSVGESESLLLVLTEGPAALVAAELAGVSAICRTLGARAVGPEPVDSWMRHRNAVPGFESFLTKGMIVDTIEVATTWPRIAELYDGVLAAMRAVPGLVVASGHSSHSYLSGTNIYFTFAGRPERSEDMEALYFGVWDAAMRATLAAGGTISHHHGIGRVRRDWLARELGSAYPLVAALKRALDPLGIMNPGVLLPAGPGSGPDARSSAGPDPDRPGTPSGDERT